MAGMALRLGTRATRLTSQKNVIRSGAGDIKPTFRSHRAIHPSLGTISAVRSNSSSASSSSNSPTTPSQQSGAPSKTLAQVLADSIRASGPVSVATYMRTCLLDPLQGYYASANAQTEALQDGLPPSARDVLGARGDFITSPEISQVFGELLAIFFVARWQSVRPNGATRLVELGPGRGTLLADMIRTFSRFSDFFNTIKSIHLVETSPGLMSIQHDAIEAALTQAGKKIVSADQDSLADDEVRLEWFPVVDSVPILHDTWTMVVAHEFFDALPTHIFERSSDGFREVLVDVERTQQGQSGITVLKPGDLATPKGLPSTTEPKFRHVLSPTPTPWSMLLAARNPRFQGLQPGQRVEVSPESWATARKIGELVAGRKAKEVKPEKESDADREKREQKEKERRSGRSQGGAGLVVDYGDEKAFGASFRAFKAHQIVDPLKTPGTADLTSNVDFAYLKNALATTDVRALGPMFQAHFLRALGLQQRVDKLMASAPNDDRRQEIQSGAQRLIDPAGMGAQYKVLGISADQHQGGTDEGEETKIDCYPFEM